MEVRHRKGQHGQSIVDPWTASWRESDEGSEGWYDPKLADCGEQETLIQFFGKPSPEQEADDEEHKCRNDEKVCFERVEANLDLGEAEKLAIASFVAEIGES